MEWEVVSEKEAKEIALTKEDKAFRCKEKIERAYRDINVGFYDLAVGLLEAHENNYPKIWGYESLEDYADKVLGVGKRKAYNLIECGRAIVAAGLPRERVEKIGWTKLSLIAREIEYRPQQAEDYVALAEKSSWRDLKKTVKELRAEPTHPFNPVARAAETENVVYLRNIKIEGDGADVVAKAIKIAQKMLNSESVSDAVNHICAEWLMFVGEADTVSLEKWVGYVSATFGVTLTVDAPLGAGAASIFESEKDIETVDIDDILGDDRVEHKTVDVTEESRKETDDFLNDLDFDSLLQQ